MTPSIAPSADRIRCLNDRLRTHFIGGQVMITQGIQALGPAFRVACVQAVRAFDTFTEDNDPHGEHEFGSVEIAGTTVFWKIDYYDRTLEYASPDPSDPAVTTRVLTILLAEEY
ncbi:MAG TPA: DUF3768 domain-containing protein [Devosiaceae bacterium]|jgi:hypothetical protein|nr:DUF3768 domain-containing protein [Devosiaceae bacterium]